MGGGVVKDVGSKSELDEALRPEGAPAVVIHFWASWCEASKQMDQVFTHLATDFPHALFLRVEAEEQPEISESYAVSAVPYFVFCKDGKTVDKLEGANPASLANKVAKIAGPASAAASPTSLGIAAQPTVLETVREVSVENCYTETESSGTNDALRLRLEQLVNSRPVFLFMKGSPEHPKCGFSRKVVDILKDERVDFGSFDILTDNDVREGMKKFSNWPTFPQLFCKGELLGGCDIAVAMHESGELKDVFKDHGIPIKENKVSVSTKAPSSSQTSAPEKRGDSTDMTGLNTTVLSRIKTLINSNPVMVFMKGRPDEPKCGFSHKVIEILKQEKVAFESFDILSDDVVRQGLKAYSNWSSYPQLYIGGELIGGSDIVLEMHKNGELKKVLAEKGIAPKLTLEDRLKNLITSSPVMLFMKGTPDHPRCGFSSKVVNVLQEAQITFGSFDILSNDEVREGLKAYSNWPTYPQLYYKGELVGGSDIVLELHNSGELKATLSE